MSTTRVSPQALLSDPAYQVFDYLPDRRQTVFLKVDPQVLESASFLDIRFEPEAEGRVVADTTQLTAAQKRNPSRQPRMHFIFHHAFVCSTLLARCLNQTEEFFSLKEPWILRRLADLKRSRSLPRKQWERVADSHLALLNKSYKGGRANVVKVTNVGTNLFQDIANRHKRHRVLYLYSDIESFLVSNLKKPPETQSKMPGLLQGFMRDSNFTTVFRDLPDLSVMNSSADLLKVCAMIWVVNAYNFKQVAQKARFQGLATLAMDDLLTDTGEALGRVSRHFGYDATADDIARMLAPEVMGRHAKDTSHAYDANQKAREQERIIASYGDQIETAVRFATPLAEEAGLFEFLRERSL